MKKSYNLFFLLFVISSMIVYFSCSDSGTDPVVDPDTVTTTISGAVFDEANAPIVGAEIKSAGQTAVTNNSGGFTFANIKVPKSRSLLMLPNQAISMVHLQMRLK